MINGRAFKYTLLLLPVLFFPAAGYSQYATAFDWLDFGGDNFIDQGPDGPCDRITTTWAIEHSVRMYYDNPVVDLSEQHIYQRCLQNLPDYQGCDTADGITAVCRADFVENYGIAAEACLPAPVVDGVSQYDRDVIPYYNNSQCINPCSEAENLLPWEEFRFRVPLVVKDSKEIGIENNNDLKQAIVKYGPHSLYFRDGPGVPGEHSILILGWNIHNEWIFMNSSDQYFDAKGVTGYGRLQFDIRQYYDIDITRVDGVPECVSEGSGCDRFTRRNLDQDGDGFCNIKWGDIPSGLGCTGHDANDNNDSVGPYNAYGHAASVITGDSTSDIVLSQPISASPPFIIRTKNKIILKPGFTAYAQSGDRGYKMYIDKSL